jgi:circadian clock protein KaiC
MTAHEVPILARLRTGSPELDEILGGGFPANSINLLIGEPGSGKTILAENLIFANAIEGERPILYLTTLSEPLDKVVRYLQQFQFFDEAKLFGTITYESIGDQLVERGIAMLVPKLKEAITTMRPKIIVIDSFKAIHDLAATQAEMRRMLYELASLLTAYETTVFLIGEYSEEHVSRLPEFAVADGMVALARSKTSVRDERYLRVIKLRGSSYLQGEHGFRISAEGLTVYPRLVSPQSPPNYEIVTTRTSLGTPDLDRMFGGGVFRGTSTLVQGPTGAGKTTLALQFAIDGIRRGEGCLIVNFEENPTQLAYQLRSFGLDPDKEPNLDLLYVSPVELQIDSIITTIFRRIASGGLKRVIIDSIGDLMMAASDNNRLQNYLYALTQQFATRGVASLLTFETSGPGIAEGRFSAMSDNLILLGMNRSEKKARRTIRIVKARGIAHDLDERELVITSKGLEIR